MCSCFCNNETSSCCSSVSSCSKFLIQPADGRRIHLSRYSTAQQTHSTVVVQRFVHEKSRTRTPRWQSKRYRRNATRGDFDHLVPEVGSTVALPLAGRTRPCCSNSAGPRNERSRLASLRRRVAFRRQNTTRARIRCCSTSPAKSMDSSSLNLTSKSPNFVAVDAAGEGELSSSSESATGIGAIFFVLSCFVAGDDDDELRSPSTSATSIGAIRFFFFLFAGESLSTGIGWMRRLGDGRRSPSRWPGVWSSLSIVM